MIDWDTVVIGPATAIFGEPVLYIPAGQPGMTITGVFDVAYKPLTPLGGHMGLEPLDIGLSGDTNSVGPVLGVQLSQFSQLPAQDDVLTVRDVLYRVREVQPDGHGVAKLLLNEA